MYKCIPNDMNKKMSLKTKKKYFIVENDQKIETWKPKFYVKVSI